MSKVVFQAEPTFQRIRNYILDFLAILVFCFSLIHFYENPIVISAIDIFILYSLYIGGYNRLIIYENEIEFKFQHLIEPLSKTWKYQFDEISSIDASLKLTKTGFLFSELFSTYISGNLIWNTISIKLTNGETKIISTKVYKKDIITSLELLSKLSNNKIIITGLN